jgi:gluconate 2-dehydrogenase gamma chain
VSLPEQRALDRRSLLQSAVLLVGGALAGVASPGWAATSGFFTPAQFALVDEIAEGIIPRTDTPGARDAGVAKALDQLMVAWASKARQDEFRGMLAEFDGKAAAEAGAPFLKLPAERRQAFLAGYDRRHGFINPTYRRFKELVLTLYYLSEIGATQELRYELVPGKWEPSVPVTPDTRAWAI